jgi:hypothetical protein
VEETVPLQHLYAMKGSGMYGLTGVDALWVSKIGDLEAKQGKLKTEADPLSFFVGKVRRNIVAEGERTFQTVDLAKYIDHDKKVVKSMTGEITWDYGNGVAQLNAPRAQGVCGFLKTKDRIELADVIIASGNDYGAVLVVALDDKPLRESRKILIQAGTQDRNYGFKTKALDKKGKRVITNVGSLPTLVENVEATVYLKSKGNIQVKVLDGYGNLTARTVTAEAGPAGQKIVLPEDTLYTLIQR